MTIVESDPRHKFGLSSETIAKICAVTSSYTSIENVIIYGSRAKGDHHLGSDIDLTIIGKKFTAKDLIQLELKLDQLNLPYQIDLSRFHAVHNPDLTAHIQRVGKSLCQAEK